MHSTEPRDGTLVAEASKVEVCTSIAQGNKVPHGYILEEDKQEGVAVVASLSEDGFTVILSEVSTSFLFRSFDSGEQDGVVIALY